jgi:hypothetical protein
LDCSAGDDDDDDDDDGDDVYGAVVERWLVPETGKSLF